MSTEELLITLREAAIDTVRAYHDAALDGRAEEVRKHTWAFVQTESERHLDRARKALDALLSS